MHIEAEASPYQTTCISQPQTTTWTSRVLSAHTIWFTSKTRSHTKKIVDWNKTMATPDGSSNTTTFHTRPVGPEQSRSFPRTTSISYLASRYSATWENVSSISQLIFDWLISIFLISNSFIFFKITSSSRYCGSDVTTNIPSISIPASISTSKYTLEGT